MYRIIGLNSNGQLKLIKKEALNTKYRWNSDSYHLWNTSNLYTNLNGSYFLNNTTYVSSAWSEKIATTAWKYGRVDDLYTGNAATVYSLENGWTNTVSAKIGLMYIHDYNYAPQKQGLSCWSSASTCLASWVHISNCDPSAPDKHEWLMVYDNYLYDGHFAVMISGGTSYESAGTLSVGNLNYESSVRPVFYLTSDVKYVSGTGTLADPILIQ